MLRRVHFVIKNGTTTHAYFTFDAGNIIFTLIFSRTASRTGRRNIDVFLSGSTVQTIIHGIMTFIAIMENVTTHWTLGAFDTIIQMCLSLVFPVTTNITF